MWDAIVDIFQRYKYETYIVVSAAILRYIDMWARAKFPMFFIFLSKGKSINISHIGTEVLALYFKEWNKTKDFLLNISQALGEQMITSLINNVVQHGDIMYIQVETELKTRGYEFGE